MGVDYGGLLMYGWLEEIWWFEENLFPLSKVYDQAKQDDNKDWKFSEDYQNAWDEFHDFDCGFMFTNAYADCEEGFGVQVRFWDGTEEELVACIKEAKEHFTNLINEVFPAGFDWEEWELPEPQFHLYCQIY